MKKDKKDRVLNIPLRNDINVFVEQDSHRVTQELTPEIQKFLKEIYEQDANIGYIQDENTLASPYHQDLLNFILENTENIKDKKVLELGCGGCSLLQSLSLKGADVTGMDPSPFARRCAKQKNIRLIQDFFNPDLIDKAYDLVIFSDVLEHVENPYKFLSDLNQGLNAGSKIIIAVPDATSEWESGDFSMLMHQHISYFTKQSLMYVIQSAGLINCSIQTASYGGSLYAICETTNIRNEKISLSSYDASYMAKAEKTASNFAEIYKNLTDNFHSIYCYVPLRAIPYLAKINQLDASNIYFVDDTPLWENAYIDGCMHQIKPISKVTLTNRDAIIVFSNTFEAILEKKIFQAHPETGSITKISDFTC